MANYQTDRSIYAFLMAGQSNMAGRGDLKTVEPINNDLCFTWTVAQWTKMYEPVNMDRIYAGVSPAASFADSFAKERELRVGLIPCAHGGTKLNQWIPEQNLYANAIFQAKLSTKGRGKLSGILWHQGESDCTTEEEVLAYREKLIWTLTTMRRELGDERLPIVLGEISEEIGEEWGFGDRPKRINQIIHEVAEALPLCGVASSKGLTLQGDGIHFDAGSQREFGRRYYAVYCELEKKLHG